MGYTVSLPLAGACPYDLVVDHAGDLLRVQVKHGRVTDGCVRASLKRTNPNHNDYNDSYYTADEIDAFAIYAPDIDRAFWVSFDEAPDSEITIRYAGESNHPATRWAADYRLAAALSEPD